MRKELWGLRKIDTKEPVYTYWASSNKYRALFAKRENAEAACQNPMNPNMEPFRITGSDTGEPERHGHWEVHFEHWAPYQRCSVCGFEFPLVSSESVRGVCPYKHCPECTARMDEKENPHWCRAQEIIEKERS